MKKCFKILTILSLTLLFYSCALIGGSQPPEWRYEKDAVNVFLKADPQLHLYQEKPHTLVMCVYQLRTPNVFQELTKDENGLSKLLECSHFDSTVASVKKLVIHPGQELTESLDRAEGAKYVAVVAGYYRLQKENVVRLFQIPVDRPIFRKIARPGLMDIKLNAGPYKIQEIGGRE